MSQRAGLPKLWLSRRGLFALVGGALVLYYLMVVLTGVGDDRRGIDVGPDALARAGGHVDLAINVTEVRPADQILKLDIQIAAYGRYAALEDDALLSEPLTLDVDSLGRPPVAFDFAAHQPPPVVGAVAALNTKTFRYPFDKAAGRLSFSMTTADGADVPLSLSMSDATSDWLMSGASVRTPDGVTLDMSAKRAFLVMCLAIFALCAIAVAAVISVAVIGASLTDGEVVFSEVIWLGAMLVAIPAMRNSMPGIPPIGTALDIFVFLPAVGVVAVSLIASTFVLASTRGMTAQPAVSEEAAESRTDDKEWDEGWESPPANGPGSPAHASASASGTAS